MLDVLSSTLIDEQGEPWHCSSPTSFEAQQNRSLAVAARYRPSTSALLS